MCHAYCSQADRRLYLFDANHIQTESRHTKFIQLESIPSWQKNIRTMNNLKLALPTWQASDDSVGIRYATTLNRKTKKQTLETNFTRVFFCSTSRNNWHQRNMKIFRFNRRNCSLFHVTTFWFILTPTPLLFIYLQTSLLVMNKWDEISFKNLIN